MVEIRKVTLLSEEAFGEMGHAAKHPVVRAVALVAIHNPFARRFVGDLTELVDAGAALAHRFAGDLVKMLHGPPVSYGKGASATKALETALALEIVADMALRTLAINPAADPAPAHLLDKHFFRKHGPGAYYGQQAP